MIQCRVAQSLGELNGTHQETWRTVDYTDRNKPTVFMGLYDLRDYIALWRHKGKAWVFWCGSDILNLKNHFLFNNGKLKLLSKTFPFFHKLILHICKKAEHWCENEVEQKALKDVGIKSKIGRSFMGKVINYDIKREKGKITKVYVSCSGDRQLEYGFGDVEKYAHFFPNVLFYLYGGKWKTKQKNVIIRGRVSKETFNRETSKMDIGLRLNEFDGFSEVVVKAMLRGQKWLSVIPYPKDRDYYIKTLNKFPWNKLYGSLNNR